MAAILLTMTGASGVITDPISITIPSIHSIAAISCYGSAMASIESYTISVPDAKLQRLAQKLDAAQFLDELEGGGLGLWGSFG